VGNSFLRTREYQKYLLNIVALYKQRPDLKAYLELILSLLTIILFVVLALKPTAITIIDLLNKIKSLEDTNNQLQTKINNLATAQGFYNLNQDKIQLLSVAVPNGSEVSTYVRQVEGAIAKENIKNVNMSVDEVKLAQATESGNISVSMTTSGDYSNLIQFVKDLESLRRPSFISKLDIISIISGGSKTLNLTATAKVPYIQTQ